MDTQTKSLIGSLLLGVAGMATGWLASHNIIPPADVSADTATIAAFVTFTAGAAVAWYKHQQASQTSMIQAVNAAPNGVKVVADDARSAPIATVNSPQPVLNAPIKEAGK